MPLPAWMTERTRRTTRSGAATFKRFRSASRIRIFLTTCFMRDDISFACQSTVLPTADADVSAIAELCLENLNRLKTACR